jgi:glucose-1-phosphate cytidylyltransferase
MKVVILCGGLGTRLREETEFRPKPMVYIGEKPILWHIMKIYAHFKNTSFIICLGYKGEIIKDYFYHYEMMNNDITMQLGHFRKIEFHNDHHETGWQVTLVNTGLHTQKGGRLKRIEPYIDDESFMVTYGDGLADVNIRDLEDFHRRHGKIATLTGVNRAARFGELTVDGDRVNSFKEKPHCLHEYFNGGFFIFNRAIFDYLTPGEDCDLENVVLEKLAQEGQLMVYKHQGSWACMDTLRDTDYLNNLWKNNQAFWKVWP